MGRRAGPAVGATTWTGQRDNLGVTVREPRAAREPAQATDRSCEPVHAGADPAVGSMPINLMDTVGDVHVRNRRLSGAGP